MTIETPALPSPRLDNIQALRAVAALIVFAYHLALFIRAGIFPGQTGFPDGPWDRGWVGVDLFFVISGFIMVWTTQGSPASLRTSAHFLWRRVARIYPLWWICAGIMAAYFLFAYGMPAPPDRVASAGEAWSFALKSFALWPQQVPPLLGLGWTLIHEMWFYLVFAGLLFFPRRYLVVGLSIWAAGTLAHSVGFGAVDSAQPVRKLVTSLLNLEFIGGALAACALRARPPRAPVWPRLVLALGLSWVALAMMMDLDLPAEDHQLTRAVIYGPAMIAIVWGSTAMALAGRAAVPIWLTKLGDWSYALYLIHYIVLIALKRIVVETGLTLGPETSWIYVSAFSGLALLLTLAASWALHRFVEQPLMRRLKRGRDRSPARMSG